MTRRRTDQVELPFAALPAPEPPRHSCHAHGCVAIVPPRFLMCRRHWSSVRPALQSAVWREYERGQEVTKKPSLRYLAVQQRAIGEVAFRTDLAVRHLGIGKVAFRTFDKVAFRDSFGYLLRAEELRRKCIDEGMGDPLEGIASWASTDPVDE